MSLRLPFGRRNIAAALFLALTATACLSSSAPDYGTPSNPAAETYATSLGVDISQMTKMSTDLYYQDLTVGTGTQVTPGKQITVTYTGWLVNGTKFDSNGTGYQFTLQSASVIAGWDLGIVGMKVGGKRRLVIGSNLAYGPNAMRNQSGVVVIPSNATLVFDVAITAADQ